jgi:hypothetical protein
VRKKIKLSYLDEKFSAVMVAVDVGSKSLEYLEDGGPGRDMKEIHVGLNQGHGYNRIQVCPSSSNFRCYPIFYDLRSLHVYVRGSIYPVTETRFVCRLPPLCQKDVIASKTVVA